MTTKIAKVLLPALGLAAMTAGVASPGTAMAVDYDCADFATQAEAQEYLLPGDPYRLDGDGDGIACESNPCPCSYGEPESGSPPEVTPPPPYRLAKVAAKRISKRLVRRVVNRSRRLQSSSLRGCARLAERRIDCRLIARGRTAHAKTTCRFKVAVRARHRHPAGRIVSRRCATRSLRRPWGRAGGRMPTEPGSSKESKRHRRPAP